MKKMKHFVATILSLSMVLAGSLTAFAAPQAEAVVTDQAVVSQVSAESSSRIAFGTKIYIKGEGVRLRKAPGTSSEVLGLLYEGNKDWVILSGASVSKDGHTWWKVTKSSISGEIGEGVIGWIAGEYL